MTTDSCWARCPSGGRPSASTTSSGPQVPSRSVAVPPICATSAATALRERSQMSPLRGAAKARTSAAPSSPAMMTATTWPLASSTWSWTSSSGCGREQQPAQVDAGVVVLVHRDLGGVPGAVGPAGPSARRRSRRSRRPRRSARPRPSGVGTSGRLLGIGVGGRPSVRKPPVEPYPPAPRAEPGSRSTSTNRACSTRCTTSWATRSPRERSTASCRVEVHQQHADLAAVARVDGPGRVDDRSPRSGPRARSAGAPGRRTRRAAPSRCRSAPAPARRARGARRRW